jgi:hypothetical protein
VLLAVAVPPDSPTICSLSARIVVAFAEPTPPDPSSWTPPSIVVALAKPVPLDAPTI